MPLYIYRCRVCMTEAEQLHKSYDDAPNTTKCTCGCGARMERVIQGTGLKFKGGGWSQDYTPRARK